MEESTYAILTSVETEELNETESIKKKERKKKLIHILTNDI